MVKNCSKVSVIVTTFNRQKLLKRCIESILDQSYKNFELIIIDNYSDYAFFDFIDSFKEDRIIPYQNQNSGIIAVNRNFGVKMSTGNFVAFCDDDDFWEKDKVLLQMKVMLSDPKILLNSTLAKKNGFKTSFGECNFGIMYRKILLSRTFLLRYNPIILSSVILRKDAFDAVNGFSESNKLITVEDLDLWIKLFDSGKISVLKQVLVNYEIHNTNVTQYHFKQRIDYLKDKMIDVNQIEMPFTSKTNFLTSYFKSVIHLIYIVYYKFIFLLKLNLNLKFNNLVVNECE